MMKIRTVFSIPIAGLAIVLLVACAHSNLQNWGHYAPDTVVTQSYEAAQLNPAYQYFYSGPDTGPTAILGLKKEYKLVTDIWQKIEPNQAALGKILDGMRTRTFGVGQSLKGYILYDHNNNPIGTWYSIFAASPSIHMLGPNEVEIYSPPSDLYERTDGGGEGAHDGGNGHH
jgi:hypothetical protein